MNVIAQMEYDCRHNRFVSAVCNCDEAMKRKWL